MPKCALWISMVVLLTLSACGSTRRSAAELDTSRQEPVQALAPQYPYTWRPRQLPREPACYDAAMCYDEERHVSVLFGGSTSHMVQLDRTHTWNGARWQRKDCWEHPSRRAGHSLVYDSKRKVCVLFGGRYGYEELNDLWEWDGSQWSRLLGSRSYPSPRAGHAMVFDSARNVMVLFGGQANPASAETWEYANFEWSKHETANSPSPRSGAAMAFDAKRQKVVLYGGTTTSSDGSKEGSCDDTWEYDGQNWCEVECEKRPGKLSNANLVYDAAESHLVLISGNQPGGYLQNSALWSYDGESWSENERDVWPRPRSACCSCYDADRRCTVVHGGWEACALDDTWEFGRNGWTQSRAASMPPVRGWLVYDELRERTVLIGHAVEWYPERHLSVWEWDGAKWMFRPVQEGPPMRTGFACYDASRCKVILLLNRGREDDPEAVAENWAWNGSTWTELMDIPPLPESVHTLCFDRRQNTYVGLAVTRDSNAHDRVDTMWTLRGRRWLSLTVDECPYDFYRAQCVYDESRGEILLMGFDLLNGFWAEATWCWNGVSWRKTSAVPDTKLGTVLIYDPIRKRTICICGGSSNEEAYYFDATWEWDGTMWERMTPTESPSPRSDALAAFDRSRGVVVLFGGECNWQSLSDTWEYGPDRP